MSGQGVRLKLMKKAIIEKVKKELLSISGVKNVEMAEVLYVDIEYSEHHVRRKIYEKQLELVKKFPQICFDFATTLVPRQEGSHDYDSKM